MITGAHKARVVSLSLAAAWAAINGCVYANDFDKRYRAEAAWFLFAAALMIAAFYALARGTREAPDPVVRLSPKNFGISLFMFVCSAVVLYFPMLSIGLLSDDFVLLSRAQAGALVNSNWEYLRPLPLVIWRTLNGFSEITAVPYLLHAFNIGVHGVNAWLTAVLATRFGLLPRSALLAGIAFLVFPTSVEAVAWPSGVFDVLLVTLVLSACVSLTTGTGTALGTILVALLTTAALFSKETAVVLPAMLTVTACLSPKVTRQRAALLIAVSLGLVVLYLPVRMMAGFAATPPSDGLSAYALKELVSRPIGALGLPFHVEFLTLHRWVPFVFALSWPALFVWSAWHWPTSPWTARRVLGLTAWVFISVLPVATMLFIAEDLQGSRYLYLGSVAWSILLTVLVPSFRGAGQVFVLVPFIVVFVIGTREHQTPWIAAAHERDRVLDAFRQSGFTCFPETVHGLPDHVQGAYVFRNGFSEAIGRARPNTAKGPCVLTWDGDRFSVNQEVEK